MNICEGQQSARCQYTNVYGKSDEIYINSSITTSYDDNCPELDKQMLAS